MSFECIKSAVRSVDMYRAAGWTHRPVMNRQELRAFREEVAFYCRLIDPGVPWFDVGAIHGAKSEVFLRLGARVVAFEPQADCTRELRARQGSPAELVAINAAVGSGPGRAIMQIGRTGRIRAWSTAGWASESGASRFGS